MLVTDVTLKDRLVKNFERWKNCQTLQKRNLSVWSKSFRQRVKKIYSSTTAKTELLQKGTVKIGNLYKKNFLSISRKLSKTILEATISICNLWINNVFSSNRLEVLCKKIVLNFAKFKFWRNKLEMQSPFLNLQS